MSTTVLGKPSHQAMNCFEADFFAIIYPVTAMSDQDRNSPHNINTISSRRVMRIKENIIKGIISQSNTKFS